MKYEDMHHEYISWVSITNSNSSPAPQDSSMHSPVLHWYLHSPQWEPWLLIILVYLFISWIPLVTKNNFRIAIPSPLIIPNLLSKVKGFYFLVFLCVFMLKVDGQSTIFQSYLDKCFFLHPGYLYPLYIELVSFVSVGIHF